MVMVDSIAILPDHQAQNASKNCAAPMTTQTHYVMHLGLVMELLQEPSAQKPHALNKIGLTAASHVMQGFKFLTVNVDNNVFTPLMVSPCATYKMD